MSGMIPPIVPFVAAGVAKAALGSGSVALPLALAALGAWLSCAWWVRLAITIDGVPYKEGRGRGAGGTSRAGRRPGERRRTEPGLVAAQDGFLTPRSNSEASPTAGDAGTEPFAEWAPFGPSLPHGERPTPPNAAPPPFWLECDASVFDVRNIHYRQTKEKVPSDFALYNCVGMDMIRDKSRIDAVMDRLPASAGVPAGSAEWSDTWGVPRVLIVNCQCPYKASVFGPVEDDGGFSVVAYFVLSQKATSLLAQGTETPSLRLWRRLVEEGVSTKDGISFKVVGRVEDPEQYEVPESFLRFNNKPVLLTKSSSMLKSRLPEVLEIDYDVRGWVYPARSALANYHHRARDAELEIGYVVEGKVDDELPEQILGCFKLNNMDITAARWVSLM